MSNIAATIITIGDELLIGQTIDTNSAWIAKRLNELGIDVLRRVAVGDTRAAIVTALDEEKERVDIILITGGLGPTSDDITKPLLCEYFGGKLKVDEMVLAHIKNLFSRLNRPIIERNLKQAEVPDNCKVLSNRMGTAPGMWFEKDGKIFISMPGVPYEMVAIMEDEVLPRLSNEFISDALLHSTVVTAGEGESYIAERLMGFESELPPHIKLAYLPDSSIVKLRLTGRGKNKLLLAEQLESLQIKLIEILGRIVVANEDIPMENVLGNALIERGNTIGIAESCTGGYIGHSVTQVVGASAYFMGSVVSYSNEMKMNVLGVNRATLDEYGAVSEQTAIEMAKGALNVLNVDYALATTGVLGPGGATERVNVGTVWMAVIDRDNNIRTKEYKFRYDRLKNKEMAAKMGMLMLWKFITGRI